MIRLFVLSLGIALLPLVAQAEDLAFDVEEEIVYATVGQRELLLDAYVPSDEGNYPAVLVVHGGAWRSGDRKQLHKYAEALARRGCVCFAIEYRLAPDGQQWFR